MPREVREALVAWEYCDDFPLLTAHTVKGEAKDVSGGAYTKTFNLGAGSLPPILTNLNALTYCFAACWENPRAILWWRWEHSCGMAVLQAGSTRTWLTTRSMDRS